MAFVKVFLSRRPPLYTRHRPRRNAFPVRMDIKILRRAVLLHIGKHLMPEMGGGLIRAYRRPQRHEGQQPTFFKITIGEHRRRHIRVRTAQSHVRDAADDLGSRQGGGHAAIPRGPTIT